MLRSLLRVVVFVSLMLAEVVPKGVAAQESLPSPKTLHASLAGGWTGTLRYRDYQDSTRFVSLPTALEGTLAADSTSVRLDFVYDDGPGKTVRSSDTFSLNAAGSELRWGPTDGKRAPSVFAVQLSPDGNPLTLTAEMDGTDDDKAARIRETLTVDVRALRILKEVRFTADGPWIFRHEYRLRR